MDLSYHTDQTGGLCVIEGGIDAWESTPIFGLQIPGFPLEIPV